MSSCPSITEAKSRPVRFSNASGPGPSPQTIYSQSSIGELFVNLNVADTLGVVALTKDLGTVGDLFELSDGGIKINYAAINVTFSVSINVFVEVGNPVIFSLIGSDGGVPVSLGTIQAGSQHILTTQVSLPGTTQPDTYHIWCRVATGGINLSTTVATLTFKGHRA